MPQSCSVKPSHLSHAWGDGSGIASNVLVAFDAKQIHQSMVRYLVLEFPSPATIGQVIGGILMRPVTASIASPIHYAAEIELYGAASTLSRIVGTDEFQGDRYEIQAKIEQPPPANGKLPDISVACYSETGWALAHQPRPPPPLPRPPPPPPPPPRPPPRPPPSPPPPSPAAPAPAAPSIYPFAVTSTAVATTHKPLNLHDSQTGFPAIAANGRIQGSAGSEQPTKWPASLRADEAAAAGESKYALQQALHSAWPPPHGPPQAGALRMKEVAAIFVLVASSFVTCVSLLLILRKAADQHQWPLVRLWRMGRERMLPVASLDEAATPSACTSRKASSQQKCIRDES